VANFAALTNNFTIMKKILFLLAVLPMMVFTACSSDDDEFMPTGTYTYELDEFFDSSNELTYNIRFIDNNQYEFSYKSVGRIIESRISTYTMSYPDIRFKDFGPDIVMEDENGIFIDENTIRIGSSEYIKK
jgi:hypothetical protein